ncbi:MAG: TIGR00730 family Rossman fold protein [Rhodospirillales bacterium]|nr:MAG: TIGR00730 family Rossman fold protein [Rhodospirillales bacterium]
MPSAPSRTLKSVCVFCGSRPGNDPAYAVEAARFGRMVAERGLTLVYGGGGIGLMGVVARAALSAGGSVVGVIPDFLRRAEAGMDGLTEIVVVETMHERKMAMSERSDAFVVLPGGVGTLEELFEILSWRTLGLHDKPMVVVDQADYWQPLQDLVDRMVDGGFASAPIRDGMRFVDTVDEVLSTLAAMPRGAIQKPLDRT